LGAGGSVVVVCNGRDVGFAEGKVVLTELFRTKYQLQFIFLTAIMKAVIK
jgi:hypothetical protein